MNRIELTDGEREAAAEAAYTEHEMRVRTDGTPVLWGDQIWSQYKWRLSIDRAIDAVNRVRAGDPVGTIRRADTGVVALMTGVAPAAPWTVFSPCGNPLGQWTQHNVSLWPVIYTPEEES